MVEVISLIIVFVVFLLLYFGILIGLSISFRKKVFNNQILFKTAFVATRKAFNLGIAKTFDIMGTVPITYMTLQQIYDLDKKYRGIKND